MPESVKYPDLTLCKAGCYVKTTGHSKPARHENRVSLLDQDDSPERPGTSISPVFYSAYLISTSKLGFVQALSCDGLVTSPGLCDSRCGRVKTAKPESFWTEFLFSSGRPRPDRSWFGPWFPDPPRLCERRENRICGRRPSGVDPSHSEV